MKHSVFPVILTIFLLPFTIHSQSVTGKLTDQNGSALPGCLLELYTPSKKYMSTSSPDGSFGFIGVSEVKENQLPKGYAVSDNYPNPFNPKTRIAITLPGSGKVTAGIYNSLGQKVKEDMQKYFDSGTNFLDLELNGLPNGFYLARISLDDKYTVIKKLVLLYGSQHLNTSGIVLESSLNKYSAALDVMFDSLVVSGNSVYKVFKNLPPFTGVPLNLGILVVETHAPLAPALLKPVNGAKYVDANTIFSWGSSPSAADFILQIAKDSLFSNLVFDRNVGPTFSCRVSGLAEMTAYYWRVAAVNKYGTSDWSKPVWSFTWSPLSVFIPSDKFQIPRTITMDSTGSLFACLINEVYLKLGIKKYDTDLKKYFTFLDPSLMPVAYWNGMKFGPGGNLYVVGPQRRIAYVAPAGSSLQTFVVFPSGDSLRTLNDLDFDSNKNIWTGGDAKKFYSVSTSKLITGFDFNGIIHALRFYNGYLYIAALRGTTERIYRYKINSSDSIGQEEIYFDLSASLSNRSVESMTFSNDGILFAALKSTSGIISPEESAGIIMINPDGSFKPFLPEVFNSDTASQVSYSSLFWDNGFYLYAIQDKVKDGIPATAVIRVNMQMQGAPNYGIK